MQANHGNTIIMNTVILNMCHDFQSSPWFCIMDVTIDRLCIKAAWWLCLNYLQVKVAFNAVN